MKDKSVVEALEDLKTILTPDTQVVAVLNAILLGVQSIIATQELCLAELVRLKK